MILAGLLPAVGEADVADTDAALLLAVANEAGAFDPAELPTDTADEAFPADAILLAPMPALVETLWLLDSCAAIDGLSTVDELATATVGLYTSM